LAGEFFIERGKDCVAGEARGVIGQEKQGKKSRRDCRGKENPLHRRSEMNGGKGEKRGHKG